MAAMALLHQSLLQNQHTCTNEGGESGNINHLQFFVGELVTVSMNPYLTLITLCLQIREIRKKEKILKFGTSQRTLYVQTQILAKFCLWSNCVHKQLYSILRKPNYIKCDCRESSTKTHQQTSRCCVSTNQTKKKT
jgi:hypothetical protein